MPLISIPTPTGNLGFSLTYDSQAAQAEITNLGGVSSYPGPDGFGWSDTYATFLTYNSTTTATTVTLGSGAKDVYESGSTSGGIKSFSPVYVGASNALLPNPRETAALTLNTVYGFSELAVKGGSQQYLYNYSGKLFEITTPDASASSTYLSIGSLSNGSSSNGVQCPSSSSFTCVAVADNAYNRSIVLVYNTYGYLYEVLDPEGNTWTFGFSGSNPENLTSITDPLSHAYDFTYDSSNGTADLESDMLSAADRDGGHRTRRRSATTPRAWPTV